LKKMWGLLGGCIYRVLAFISVLTDVYVIENVYSRHLQTEQHIEGVQKVLSELCHF